MIFIGTNHELKVGETVRGGFITDANKEKHYAPFVVLKVTTADEWEEWVRQQPTTLSEADRNRAIRNTRSEATRYYIVHTDWWVRWCR